MKYGRKLLALATGAALTLSLALPCFTAPADTTYIDVASDAWYADAVNYVRESGLMGGTSATTFSPESTMSRAMLAAVLYRAAGEPEVTGEDRFPDTSADEWYSDAVVWASQNEYINGYDNGRFGTNDPVTREQFAAIFRRYAASPAAGSAPDFADAPGVVKTTAGLVRGTGQNGVLCYLGVPSAEGMPKWEPYTRQGGATMLLNDEPELVHHHDRELMKLLAPDYEY